MDELRGTPIDHLLAGWVSSGSACAAGRYLRTGASLPQRAASGGSSGRGFPIAGPPAASVVPVLRECYGRGLLRPALEEVEVAALAVMPEPEDEEGWGSGFFRVPSARERWEREVAAAAARAHEFLKHGPTADLPGASALLEAGLLEAQVSSLRLRQRVDLLFRRPGGQLGAVLVLEDRHAGPTPPVAEEDWRSVLAAAVVRSLHGAIPRVHLVWAHAGAAQTVVFSPENLGQKIGGLAQAASEARAPDECRETVTYPLTGDAVDPLRDGSWPEDRGAGRVI